MAANAALRPRQNPARSASVAATRTSVARPAAQHSRTRPSVTSTSAAGPSSSTSSTAPAPTGSPAPTACSAASMASVSIISTAAGRMPAAMMADTARPAASVEG